MGSLSRVFRMDTVLCALLCLGAVAPLHAAGAAQAASVPVTLTPPQESKVQELDEVIVRGKRLTEAIADAEDEFFSLFNKLNTDDDYDTHCVNLNVDTSNRNSRLTTRLCIPGFLADAMADTADWKVRCEPEFVNYDTNRDRRVSQWEAGVNADLVGRFAEFDTNSDLSLDEQEFKPWADQTAISSNCYHPPPPDLVLTGRTKDWYEHSMKVIKSDPRLEQMAGHLDDLYAEWAEVQRRYGSIKGEGKAPPTTRRERGPRRP